MSKQQENLSRQKDPHVIHTTRILVGGLVFVNLVFIVHIFLFEGFYTTSDNQIQMRQKELEYQKKLNDIEEPLLRYVNLKIEIQDDIRRDKSREVIYSKICKAIPMLKSVLEIPDLHKSLEPYKVKSLRNELKDLQKKKLTYSKTGKE